MLAAENQCTVCGGPLTDRMGDRIDGIAVIGCAVCGMGRVERLPDNLDDLYRGDYFSSTTDTTGYTSYEDTASHSLAWIAEVVRRLTSENATILDVGCADGHLLKSTRARRRLGIELNASMAAAAASAGIDIIADDIFDEDRLDAWFGQCNMVTAIAVLEHLVDIRAGLDVMVRLMADDGVLIFEVPLVPTGDRDSVWLRTSLEHIWYPTVPSLDALITGHSDMQLFGMPNDIKGFGWTFVGIASRDPQRLNAAKRLLESALLAPIDDVSTASDRRLRFLYDVLYRADPEEAHSDFLDALTEEDMTGGAFRRLGQLLSGSAGRTAYLDAQCASLRVELAKALQAFRDVEEARDWHRDQAKRWRDEATRRPS
jgi:SAM-dependent methyltransferase